MEKLTKRQGRGKVRMNLPASAHPRARILGTNATKNVLLIIAVS